MRAANGAEDTSSGRGTPVALSRRAVGLDSFKIVRVIGKGSFGKVRVRVLGFASRSAAWPNVLSHAFVRWIRTTYRCGSVRCASLAPHGP